MNRLLATLLVPLLLLVGAAPTTAARPETVNVVFTDIDATSHADAIRAVTEAGIAQGFASQTFRPDDDITRGQMASLVARSAAVPAVDAPTTFADTSGTTHEAAIDALTDAGVAVGFPDGTFRPNLPVSRGQMAAFLARAFEPPVSTTVRFSDVAGTTHEAAINALAEAGITVGYRDGSYRPGRSVTRGEVATFIARSLELVSRIDPPPGSLRAEQDPTDPSGWDLAADRGAFQDHFDRVRTLFTQDSASAIEALAASQWPELSANQLSACLWDDAFPGFKVLDEVRYTVETTWSHLTPDPGWSIHGLGSPTDDGYRVYLADYVTTEAEMGFLPLLYSGRAHLGIDADGHVVEFLDCDAYLG